MTISEYADAEKEFSMAITVNPEYEKSYINRGKLYKTIGRYNAAIADLTKAIEINPDRIELREELADIYLCLDTNKGEIRDIAGAMKDLFLVCLLSPENVEAWYRLGVLYLYQGDIPNAEACFLKMRNIMEKNRSQKSIFVSI